LRVDCIICSIKRMPGSAGSVAKMLGGRNAAQVATHEPKLMPFVQGDDMVPDLPAATSHPPFRVPFCQGDWILVRLKRDDVSIEFRIAIEDHEDHTAVGASFRKGLAQFTFTSRPATAASPLNTSRAVRVTFWLPTGSRSPPPALDMLWAWPFRSPMRLRRWTGRRHHAGLIRDLMM
jgi:hypothetical protein